MATTLSYNETTKGWVSFHSYEPEWMERLGADFYSFKDGNIYKHDTNTIRNEFYGVTYSTSVTFSANKAPSDIKLFKTLKLETNSGNWYADLSSEMETGEVGTASNLKFVDKESLKYGYIRRKANDDLNFNELSITGLGELTSLSGNDYTFNATIPNQISANNTDGIGGDELYFDDGTTQRVGTISAITGNVITVVSTVNAPGSGDFCFVVKDAQAESYGLRGYYSNITLTNDSTDFVELFASNAEVFKSYM
jgi:hypothetical protein